LIDDHWHAITTLVLVFAKHVEMGTVTCYHGTVLVRVVGSARCVFALMPSLRRG
jgi:hypothetical protein